MSSEHGSDGTTKPDACDATDSTQDAENGRAESWQAGPSSKELSNATYTGDIHKPTDCRTDIRTTDAHASWREVYRACHVGVGMNE